MKILYALQSTGNGHIARAQEIIPILKKYGEVDVLTSGHQSQIQLNHKIKYQLSGVSLIYNKKGGLSYFKIVFGNNYVRALNDVFKIPLKDYDLILNDFEPITAWACKLRGIKNIQISHQCALLYKESPKPKKIDLVGNLILKHYAPSKNRLGFHFKRYHTEIQPPVIREEIRKLKSCNHGHYLVYLPSFYDDVILKQIKKIDVQWKVFSKYAKKIHKEGNVEVYPIDQQKFLTYFESCAGILCNAGFETPAEAIYLGKKLFVIPIKNQYEQECNSAALAELGVSTSNKLDLDKINNWIQGKSEIHCIFSFDLEEVIRTKVLEL